MKSIYCYYLELNKEVDICFKFENSSVDVVEVIPGSDIEKNEYGYLRFVIEFSLKEYESIGDGPIFTRPAYLNLLGLVSFVLNEPLNVFESTASSGQKLASGNNPINISDDTLCLVEGEDLSKNLEGIIKVIISRNKYEKELVFSLLDRWRKGLYLEKDTEESLLFNDESTLLYFHILELLGEVYSSELKERSKVLIGEFVEEYNENILSLTEGAYKAENSAKNKILFSLLNKDISVNAKIAHFLKRNNLYTSQTSFWINSLIKERNNVAHGKQVFYGKAIFPVQPFYPVNRSNLYPLEFLRTLTAKAICCHLDNSLYDSSWEEVSECLIKNVSEIKSFLKAGNFSEINTLHQDEKNIVLGGIDYHVLSKKIPVNSCIDFYKAYVKKSDEDFFASNIHLIVLLYEVIEDLEIKESLRQTIIKINSLGYNPHFKFRDLRYFLEFHNYDSPKLEELIIAGEIK
jgi:hypothetical protein